MVKRLCKLVEFRIARRLELDALALAHKLGGGRKFRYGTSYVFGKSIR